MIKHSFKKLVNNEFFRNVLTVFTGTSLSQSIPVIIMPILTRLYPEDIFGVFFIYSASVMILTIIATLKYELAIVLAENQEDAFNLLFLTLIISFFISIFIGTLCFIFSSLIGKLLNNNGIIPWLPLLPISVFLVSTFRAFQFWCNRNKTFKTAAYGKVTKSATTGITQIGAGFAGLPSGIISGLVAGQFVSAFYMGIRVLSQSTSLLKHLSLKRMAWLGKKYKIIPTTNTLITLINTLSNYIPLFILTRFFGVVTASFYGLSNRVVKTPSGIIQQSISEVFYQEAAKLHNQQKELFPFIKKMYIRLFKTGIIPYLIFFFIAPVFFEFVFGKSWAMAGLYTKIMIPWLFLAFLNSPLSSIVTVLNKQRGLLIYNIILLIFRILALYLGYLLFNEAVYSILFFSVTGIIFNIFLFFYFLNIARNASDEVQYKTDT